MGFDNLITIGIIIYIIYSIKKTFSSGKKTNEKTPQKSSGWAGKLGDLINDVKAEIEKAQQEAMAEQKADTSTAEHSAWDDLRERTPEVRQTDPEPSTINQTLFYEPQEIEEPPPIVSPVPARPEEYEHLANHRNEHGNHDDPMPLPVRKVRQNRYIKMSRTELKKAVIWSEIISKPVGLRE